MLSAGIVQSRRLLLHLAKNNNRSRPFFRARVFSSASTADASHLNDKLLPPTVAAQKTSWKFLKYGLLASLLGASATVGYTTYSYPVEQVDEMTKAFRESVKNSKNHTIEDDASSIGKVEALLKSAAMTVPAKCIETYLDLRRSIEDQVLVFTEPTSDKLLPDLDKKVGNVLTLVLDLNETLLYTDWKRERGWKTIKRPGVDAFLERLSHFYEIVIYSDQPDIYVGPVVERLNENRGFISHCLSRTATRYQNGKHYRDLSKLNRDPSRVLYVSGHALESSLQPENCAPIQPYKFEEGDTALIDLLPFLEFVARQYYAPQGITDVRQVLANYKGCDIATEFNRRQRQIMESQKSRKQFWRW